MISRLVIVACVLGCNGGGRGGDAHDDLVLPQATSELEDGWKDPVGKTPESATTAEATHECGTAKLVLNVTETGTVNLRLTRPDIDWVTVVTKATLGKKVLFEGSRPEEVSRDRLPFVTTIFELSTLNPVKPGVTYGGDLSLALDEMTPTGKGISIDSERAVDEARWKKLPPSTWQVSISFPDEAGRTRFLEQEKAEREMKGIDRQLSLHDHVIADARKRTSDAAKKFVALVDHLIAERDARKKLLGDGSPQPITITIACAKP